MFIRVSGKFIQLLNIWLVNQPGDSRVLQEEVAALARKQQVPVELWRSLLQRAAEFSESNAFGLQVGGRCSLEHVGALGFLIVNTDKLTQALTTYQQFERRFYGVDFCFVERTPSQLRLAWPDRLGDENALFVQVALSALVAFLRQRFPSTFHLQRVELTEQQPACEDEYRAYFGCEVVFGSNTPGITVDQNLASGTERGELPASWQQIRRWHTDASHPAANPFIVDLRQTIQQMLPEGRISLRNLAQTLAMSPRTLQRRLTEMSYTYQLILDVVREQLSCRYLAETDLTYSEIALLLGFSEQSALNRAFKGWRSISPGEYRHRSFSTNSNFLGNQALSEIKQAGVKQKALA